MARLTLTINGVHGLVNQLRTRDAGFDESKVKRNHGQFSASAGSKGGSTSGGKHSGEKAQSEGGSKSDRSDVARASMTHGKGTGKFTKEDHESSGKYHQQQYKKASANGNKEAAIAHQQAFFAHMRASHGTGTSEEAHAASKTAGNHPAGPGPKRPDPKADHAGVTEVSKDLGALGMEKKADRGKDDPHHTWTAAPGKEISEADLNKSMMKAGYYNTSFSAGGKNWQTQYSMRNGGKGNHVTVEKDADGKIKAVHMTSVGIGAKGDLNKHEQEAQHMGRNSSTKANR